MASNFSKRLDRLERLAAELIDRAVADRFLPFNDDFTAEDYNAVRDLMLEQMVSDGEILPGQRVRFIRWMTKDEDAATARRLAEAMAWSTPSEEAAAAQPGTEEPPPLGIDNDLLAEAERHRKFMLPIDEIVPIPEGIV